MYDINIKNVKKGKNIYYLFFIVGVLFLVVFGGLIVSNMSKSNRLDSTIMSTRVEVTSHYSDGTKMYSQVYYYEVDGVSYSCDSNSSSSINPGTKNKTVYYNSADPSDCMTEYSKTSNLFLIVFLILPAVFISISVINIKKIKNRIKAIEELNMKGKLVKGIPYRLENTGITVNNVQIQKTVIEYVLPSGSTVTLHGDPRHDKKLYDADGLVDLLIIDESNPDNYYIDFEINRLTGNSSQDYYSQNHQNNSFNQNQMQQSNQSNYPPQI